MNIYTVFFRFPSLVFRMDYSALGLALVVSLGASVLGVLTVVWQAVQTAPRGGDAAGAARGFQAVRCSSASA